MSTGTPLDGLDGARPVLALDQVSKHFPGVKALDQVKLSLFAGQVTALIGENGAGKSTVVKTLTGIYQPTSGHLLLDGKAIHFVNAQAALQAGVTAIHQETVLFDELSVAENIFIGHAPKNRIGLLDIKALQQKAQAVLLQLGLSIDPQQKLKELSIASRHLVAIARALSVDARVVIMDEPTAALSQKEIEELYGLIETLKKQGKAILFISHKFDEIFRIADRYTVFRDGQWVGDGLMSEVDESALVRMMVGRAVDQIFPKRQACIGEPVLNVTGLSHPTEFDQISFSLRRGEVLGFYGLVGAGRSELMQALIGITPTSAGTVALDGQVLSIRSPADAVDAGMVYVPEDRGKQGAILSMPVFANVTLPSLDKLSSHGLLRLAKEFELARTYTERLDLRAASLDTTVGSLSGGNQQKVVIAKWLATQPRVVILDEPTKGIDIGSKAAVHDFMSELTTQGLSVIMVSSEIPEILGMSDRVIVMREGRMAAELSADELSPETLVRYAAGISTDLEPSGERGRSGPLSAAAAFSGQSSTEAV